MSDTESVQTEEDDGRREARDAVVHHIGLRVSQWPRAYRWFGSINYGRYWGSEVAISPQFLHRFWLWAISVRDVDAHLLETQIQDLAGINWDADHHVFWRFRELNAAVLDDTAFDPDEIEAMAPWEWRQQQRSRWRSVWRSYQGRSRGRVPRDIDREGSSDDEVDAGDPAGRQWWQRRN